MHLTRCLVRWSVELALSELQFQQQSKEIQHGFNGSEPLSNIPNVHLTTRTTGLTESDLKQPTIQDETWVSQMKFLLVKDLEVKRKVVL